MAQTLDGRLALAGQATELSTSEGHRCAHEARAAADAVLVGANTIRIDDPRLTVREIEPPPRAPLRVVLASCLDVKPDARVVGPGLVVIGVEGKGRQDSRSRLESAGAEIELVGSDARGNVRLDAALEALAARGVRRLLVEGGAQVLTSFFEARLVDRLEVEIAMSILGAPATTTLGHLGVGAIGCAPRLENVTVERLGVNVLVCGDVVHA